MITCTVQEWTTVSLPRLKNDNLPFSITNQEVSPIICLKGIDSLIGQLMAHNLLDIISDKNCLQLSCQFFISAWFDAATLPTVHNARMILIDVGISNMVYSTCISGNKNVRDVLATLSMTSIFFKSLTSIGSLMQPSSRFFCTRYRPSQSFLRFLYS